MQIELIGCTGAGKSTLASSLVRSCRGRGIPLVTSREFVLRRSRLHWIPGRALRTIALDLCAGVACLATMRRHRALYGFAVRTIFRSPALLRHKLNLLRNVLKKIGVYEIIYRGCNDDQLVLVDEGTVHAVHNLFVHAQRQADLADLSTFVGLVPLPDVVVLVEQSESVLIDRTVARGHKRIPNRSRAAVEGFVKAANEVFHRLAREASIAERLLVVDGRHDGVADPGAAGRPQIVLTRDILRGASDHIPHDAGMGSPAG
ncbi:MAG: hypothetical protein GXY83_40460 [Rhodopirellula sp.]|nr:hypothetical protein [Rhodopirellula sp.]